MSQNYKIQSNNTNRLSTLDGIPVRCLYITRLPSSAVYKDLVNFFTHYGCVKSFFISRNNTNIKKFTYGFVTYKTPEEAYSLFEQNGKLKYMNNKLVISIADSWHQPTEGPDGTVNYQPRHKQNNEKNEKKEEEVVEEEEEELGTNDDELVPIVTQSCPLAKLNDDCLLHIIDYIPFSRRHILNQVCQRWRNLMSMYWGKITKLDFNQSPFSEMPFSQNRLELYLNICPNIVSISLSRNNQINTDFNLIYSPTSKSIVTTALQCRNLEELSLVDIQMDHRPLAILAHSCRNLKTLSMTGCKFQYDNEISHVMKKCQQLKSLHLSNCIFQPGLWLKNLKRGLTSLSLVRCNVNYRFLIEGLKELKHSLVELTLIFDGCSQCFDYTTLSNFTMLECLVYTNNTIQYLMKCPTDLFKNLRHLELESNHFITNEVLKGIVAHSPKLKILNVSRMRSFELTAEGIQVISNLTGLTELNLSFNQLVDDALLEKIANSVKALQVITLNNCNQISDVGCKSIVSNLMKLEVLGLDGCTMVTNNTVHSAIHAAVSNPDKAKLSIYACDSGISEVQPLHHVKVSVSFSFRTQNWLTKGYYDAFPDFIFDGDLDEDEGDSFNADIDGIFYDDYDTDDYNDDFDDFDEFDLQQLNPFNYPGNDCFLYM